jgi:hypothetical protein
MSQIAFFTRDGDIRDWRSRISRPKRGALIRTPVQEPAKSEFVINSKPARQFGLEIPQPVIARASEVIDTP